MGDMENYLMLNGRRVDLTDDQIRLLHLNPNPVYVLENYTMKDVLLAIRTGRAREVVPLHSYIKLAGYRLEVIGYDHDHRNKYDKSPSITVMADRIICKRRMYDMDTESGKGWHDSELREWLHREFYKTLPAEIRKIVMPTKRTTYDRDGTVHYTDDYLFLPTEYELFGSAIFSADAGGKRYEAFASSDHRVRFDADGDPTWYWTASPGTGCPDYLVAVSNGGYVGNGDLSYALGVPLCFQIS